MSAPKSVAVFTPPQPREDRGRGAPPGRAGAPRPGSSCWCPARRSTSTGSRTCPGPTFDADPLTADLALVFGGDGTILTTHAPVRRAATCRCSRSTSAPSASCPRSRAPTWTTRSGARCGASTRCCRCRCSAPDRRRASRWRSTTSRSTAARTCAWPSWPTRSQGQELGQVRCDGLVVATPAGSTGYNLANGGPVLAWGVEGYVVSFIAPHTLTARALVVAPDDVLEVRQPLRRRAGRRDHRRPPGARAGAGREPGDPLPRRPGAARAGRGTPRSTTACVRSSAA